MLDSICGLSINSDDPKIGSNHTILNNGSRIKCSLKDAQLKSDSCHQQRRKKRLEY